VVLVVAAVFFFRDLGLLAPSRRAAEKTAEPEIQMLPPDKQLAAVREVMNVRLATEEAGVRTFHGPAVTGPLRVARTAHVGDHRVLYRRPTHTAAQRPDSVNRWPPLAGLFDPRYPAANHGAAATRTVAGRRAPLRLCALTQGELLRPVAASFATLQRFTFLDQPRGRALQKPG